MSAARESVRPQHDQHQTVNGLSEGGDITEDREVTEEEVARIQEGEEAVKPQVHRTGLVKNMPAQEEVECHMISHYPFRSWCPHCVFGKGVASPHKKSEKDIRDFNVVHMDYMFFEKIDAKEREEEKQRRSGSPVLVICDEEFGIIHAQFVPSKGVNDWSVKMVKQYLEALGSKRLAIRSDQEPAIIALRNEVKRHTHVEIIDENSQAYESQTNGFIENVVKRVQGHYRTIKDSVESRFRSRLSSDHVCLPWLLI